MKEEVKAMFDALTYENKRKVAELIDALIDQQSDDQQ